MSVPLPTETVMHGRVSLRVVASVGMTAAVCGVVMMVGACSSSSTTGPGTVSSLKVRFLHGAPFVGAVDLYDSASTKSRTKVQSGLAFGGVDSLEASQGTHWYDVTLTGQAATVSAAPQAGSALLLGTFNYDVVVLQDSGANGAISGQLLPAVIPDTVTTNTKVRVVQGGHILGGVDLYFLANGAMFGGSANFSNLTFPLNTSTGNKPTFYGATSGSVEIVVMPHGNHTQASAYLDTTVTLTPDQAWTAVLYGIPTPSIDSVAQPPTAHLVWLRDK